MFARIIGFGEAIIDVGKMLGSIVSNVVNFIKGFLDASQGGWRSSLTYVPSVSWQVVTGIAAGTVATLGIVYYLHNSGMGQKRKAGKRSKDSHSTKKVKGDSIDTSSFVSAGAYKLVKRNLVGRGRSSTLMYSQAEEIGDVDLPTEQPTEGANNLECYQTLRQDPSEYVQHLSQDAKSIDNSRMFKTLADSQNVSLILSEALDEIGVNEEVVMERRRLTLLLEKMGNFTNRFRYVTNYCLGSDSEGTTTLGLNSDVDTLFCKHNYNVMQDRSEWKKGAVNLLMIQDETTTPGYCFLQRFRKDQPLPMTDCTKDDFISRGRICMKNVCFHNLQSYGVQNGPSCAIPGPEGYSDLDVVTALPCKSWPHSAARWLARQGIGRWPTTEMKIHSVRNGCFVVPVGSKVSANMDFEWRISTSLAERHLMFNLNITQIRCYILMKMILKTISLKVPEREKYLSSFMCKTVLLHCIENTEPNTWTENNLLICLTNCLIKLYNCFQNNSCSHFIVSENNLMAGQSQDEVKHHILDELKSFTHSDVKALFKIETDNLGQILNAKMNGLHPLVDVRSMSSAEMVLSHIYFNFARTVSHLHASCFFEIGNQQHRNTEETDLHTFTDEYESRLENTACRLFEPLFCTTQGTILASYNIEQKYPVSHEALEWLSAGLNSDVLSSRLKLASVFYSAGNMEKTEFILRHAEMLYNNNTVQPICICWENQCTPPYVEFARVLAQQNEDTIFYKCAYCVKFFQDELNCVPRELQYEMFRSTKEELKHRDSVFDYWMDWAVVDSLSYLYFLQYKTYCQLQRYQDKQEALSNLQEIIATEPNLWHRETALNLLGQCREQENEPQRALGCYMLSLKIRANNNAGMIHICSLLAKIVSHR